MVCPAFVWIALKIKAKKNRHAQAIVLLARVGLLLDWPSGKSGLPSLSHPTSEPIKTSFVLRLQHHYRRTGENSNSLCEK